MGEEKKWHYTVVSAQEIAWLEKYKAEQQAAAEKALAQRQAEKDAANARLEKSKARQQAVADRLLARIQKRRNKVAQRQARIDEAMANTRTVQESKVSAYTQDKGQLMGAEVVLLSNEQPALDHPVQVQSGSELPIALQTETPSYGQSPHPPDYSGRPTPPYLPSHLQTNRSWSDPPGSDGRGGEASVPPGLRTYGGR